MDIIRKAFDFVPLDWSLVLEVVAQFPLRLNLMDKSLINKDSKLEEWITIREYFEELSALNWSSDSA